MLLTLVAIFERKVMKPSTANSTLSKQSGQEISTDQVHISTLNNHVYRYSYNLGLLDFRAQRKENAIIFPGRRPVKIQRSPQEYNSTLAGKLNNGRKLHQSVAIPTVIEVAPAESYLTKETERNGQEIGSKIQEAFSTKEIRIAQKGRQKIYVNVCQKEANDFKEPLETDTTPTTSPASSTKVDCLTKDHGEDREFNAQCLPAIEKFRRAARVLGVCLPPRELYCLQRRNGVCEGNSDCSLEQRTLLRILNKRF